MRCRDPACKLIQQSRPAIALAGRPLVSSLQWPANRANGRALMGILAWILFGLVVGVIAKLLMPGRDPGGFIVTILLGIAGALVGGFLGRAMGLYQEGEAAGWIMSILGAILLLVLYRLVARRRA
jgi:uncharacterized membrane protein YeaQ/YmgE (transglycosylase-associated protein family)